MTDDPHSTDLLDQLGDELKLHAWLRAAEFRNPSLHRDETREEVDALVRIRDELRLQLHLGRLEAADEFEQLEGVWRKVKRAASQAEDRAEERIADLLAHLRAGYRRFRE